MEAETAYVIVMFGIIIIVGLLLPRDCDSEWLYNTYGYMAVEDKKGKRKKVLLSPMTYEQRVKVVDTINKGEWFFWEGTYYNPKCIVEIHIVPKNLGD